MQGQRAKSLVRFRWRQSVAGLQVGENVSTLAYFRLRYGVCVGESSR